MPQVLNVRHLSGFAERQPIIPPGAVYIGRRNARYQLQASQWANPFSIKREADREAIIATYERWVRRQPRLMDALHELRGRDLVCWCAPLPCHGDVLLRLANSSGEGGSMMACEEAPAPRLRRVARRVSEPAIPARIGPVVFASLGRWVAVSCPHEYATLMRRAGGTWDPDHERWVIHVRRIDPVLRVLRRVHRGRASTWIRSKAHCPGRAD